MSPFDNSAKRIFQPTSNIWSVTSSQVIYFQHPLPPKKSCPARRLGAEVTDCSIRRQPVARLVCDFQSSRVFSTSAASQKAAAWEARSSACGSKSQTVQSGVSRWPGWSVTSSQVIYFQHPLPPKKSCSARRLGAEVTDCSIRRQPVARLVCDFQSSHLFSTSAASQKKLPCSSAWGRSHRLFNPASAGGQADLCHYAATTTIQAPRRMHGRPGIRPFQAFRDRN